MHIDRLSRLLSGTLLELEHSVGAYMPEGAFRDYFKWALSESNPLRDQWLATLGADRVTRLTFEFLDGVIEDSAWPTLAPHISLVNVYLMYEVVSDNLAVGLARQTVNDKTYNDRRQLLHRFNTVMIGKLSGWPGTTKELLRPLERIAGYVSGEKWGSVSGQDGAVISEYQTHAADVTPAEVEYGLWPLLVANIESCVAVREAVAGYATGQMVCSGLMRRYQAMNELLENDAVLPRRVHLGADAVLAMPVLGFYAGLLEETLWHHARFADLVEDGTLGDVLFSAALLVRILNDLGTPLVSLGDDERSALIASLTARRSARHGAKQFDTFILDNLDAFPELLFQICKDIRTGAFNSCMYGLGDSLAPAVALTAFAERLDYLSKLYAQCRMRLEDTLGHIDEALGDDHLSRVIRRFVQFHRVLYATPMESVKGVAS